MKGKDNLILEYALLVITILFTIGFFVHFKNLDINLCRYALRSLVNGNPQVERFIEWKEFKILGEDIGTIYKKLPNEQEQLKFKRDFIKNFSLGFKRSGGKLNSFTNWRIYRQNGKEVIIAVDNMAYKKTVLFTVSKYGRHRLTSIQWKEDK